MTKNRDNQYRHELRKMEKEYKKLQERLGKVASEVRSKDKVCVATQKEFHLSHGFCPNTDRCPPFNDPQ